MLTERAIREIQKQIDEEMAEAKSAPCDLWPMLFGLNDPNRSVAQWIAYGLVNWVMGNEEQGWWPGLIKALEDYAKFLGRRSGDKEFGSEGELFKNAGKVISSLASKLKRVKPDLQDKEPISGGKAEDMAFAIHSKMSSPPKTVAAHVALLKKLFNQYGKTFDAAKPPKAASLFYVAANSI